MVNGSNLTETLSARQFAEGLLAGLAAADHRQISASQIRLHKAFRQVLTEASKSKSLMVDFSDVDYDPLYGLSGWLDEFLARAQRDLIISSPNPTYGRIEINFTPSEGEDLLAQYPNGDILKGLSKRFAEELSV